MLKQPKRELVNISKEAQAKKNHQGFVAHTAFTLAEILITLGIIGVVAALTIPTLIANVQKQQYVTAFAKAYSTTQQMFKMYMSDQGVTNLGDTALFDGFSFYDAGVQNEVDAMVHKYFKAVKACKAGASNDGSCKVTYKYLNIAGTIDFFATGYYSFYTPDGMEIGLTLSSSCTADYTKTGQMKADCGYIFADVNGTRGPNIVGRDRLDIGEIGHDGTILPYFGRQYADFYNNTSYYWGNTPAYCGSPGNSNIPNGTFGYGCSARIMENGWVMDY